MSYVGEAAIVPRASGLTVEQAMTRVGAPCPKCHRSAMSCYCRSHAQTGAHAALTDDDLAELPREGRLPKDAREKLKASVTEMYYGHDIAGILRLLDKVLA